MEVGFNDPYELEDGELPEEDCSNHPNNVRKDANDLSKNGNEIADPATQAWGQLQETFKKSSIYPNQIWRDVSTVSDAGKEFVAGSFQECGVPSLHNSERPSDDQNPIQRNSHKIKDRKETGDMMFSERIPHQKSWKMTHEYVSHIPRDAIDARKTGNVIVDINVSEREPCDKIRKIQSSHDSTMGKDVNEPIRVGDEARNTGRTPRETHKGKDRKETRDMIVRELIPHQQSSKRSSYDDVNHIPRDGFDARKTEKAIGDIILPERETPEKSRKKQCFHHSNHMGNDANGQIKGGNEARDKSRTLRDAHKRKDGKELGDMKITEPVPHQKAWKRMRHDDLYHIARDGTDVRKTGKAIADIILPEREPPRDKQSFHGSNHMGKDANEPVKAGDEAADMSKTLRDWINSRAEDRSIIWPPVVIIENIITGFNKTTNVWDGLKNNEIKSCLKSIKDLEYKKVTAIYNHRNGHRGSAVVVFDANDIGYMNADNLSQCLQRVGRGREDWYAVRPRGLPISEPDMERWNARGLIADDGTRIIYGYLADPSDLIRLKPYVNRVSVESFVKKVLEPMKQRCQETEKVCRNIQELEEKAEQKRQTLESEMLEIDEVAEELKKKDDEVQIYKKQQEEAERTHKLKMEEKRRNFDMVMKEKCVRYQQREAEIRAKLFTNKIHFEKETEEYRKTENELEQGIEKEKNKQELRLAEIRQNIALRQERLEKELQAKMEKKYAELEERLYKKKLELQAKHHKQVLEFKEKAQKERQQFLQRKLEEKNELEKELEIARQETDKLSGVPESQHVQAAECVICHTKFGPKVSRALYEECGHKDACMNCAKKQKTKRKCPICNKQQAKNYVIVPYKIFC